MPPRPAPTAITITGLACMRGERLLFRDLSLRLSAGEGLEVTGPNGVGKTSLLRLIAGFGEPAAGTIRIEGLPEDAEARLFIDLLGMRDGLRAALTAEEALRDALALAGGGRGASGAVEAALARFGLSRQARLQVGVLSAGQRRRLALAAIALRARPVLLLDEPLNALDAEGREALAAFLSERLAAGAMAIAATHAPLGVPAFGVLALEPHAPPRGAP
jgi:heme exporter protein A